jgi:nitrite reductase/ring-hydroxylating ferredoxin subunit
VADRALTRPDARVAPAREARIPVRRIPQPPPERIRSTWQLARPARIRRALDVALARDPGGWFVVGASADVPARTSVVRTVDGREVVLWRRNDGALVAGPGACPHMGALLEGCPVEGSVLYCRWHGMELPASGSDLWTPWPALDDGVLLWVRLPATGETPTDRPAIPERPPLSESIIGVISEPGRCEPRDIVANRLDPWHGAWYHPYAFSHLSVDDDASSDENLVVDVTFRLSRGLGIPVRAVFSCPDARTVVMAIVAGEGAGSIVETHATPLGVDGDGQPRTMMVEATVAHSPRAGFRVARRLSPLVRQAMRHTARRLWVDDLAYAERRFELRRRGDSPG